MNNQPVDDATAVYILETRKSFEDLRQIAAQIAGALVLAAANVGQVANLQRVADPLAAAAEAVRCIRPTKRARGHHQSLIEAADALSIALARALAATPRMEIDPILIPVRAAYTHLQHASNTLPGFEMVAFNQGCCGAAL